MTEIIHVFQTPVTYGERGWAVEAWGQGREDGRWEGWLVFTPSDGTPPLATERETTQSNRQALVYWAGGLAPTYLDGAFRRALSRGVTAAGYSYRSASIGSRRAALRAG